MNKDFLGLLQTVGTQNTHLTIFVILFAQNVVLFYIFLSVEDNFDIFAFQNSADSAANERKECEMIFFWMWIAVNL